MLDENEMKDCEDAKYELSGVIIHSGGSEGGHYYSIINDQESGKWFEFDDTKVSEFNINNLKNDCFGSEERDNYDIFQKSKNAYLLFYRRIKPLVNNSKVTF